MKNITVLGVTGSIGTQTIDVVLWLCQRVTISGN